MNRRGFFGLIGSAVVAAGAARVRAALPFLEQPALPVMMNARLIALIQERTLTRVFRDSLYQRILFRMETADCGPGYVFEGLWSES